MILHGRDAILRVRVKWLIFNMISQLWACVKYHVPTGFGFSPKARGFYPFGDATAFAVEGGVGDVAWLIQAPTWNQTFHSTNDRCEALASPKGCFVCFLFLCPQHLSTEPCYSLTRWPVDLKKIGVNWILMDLIGEKIPNSHEVVGGGWCGSSRICGGDSGAVVWGFLYVFNSFCTISKLW